MLLRLAIWVLPLNMLLGSEWFMDKVLVIIFIVILLSYCNENKKDSNNTDDSNSSSQLESSSIPPSNLDIGFLCKATAASIFGRDVGIMKAKKKNDKYYITYIRPVDGIKWGIYCWVEGGRVLWQTDGRNNTSDNGGLGRIRNGEYDEYITYSVQGDTLIINTRYSDNSAKSEEFMIPKSEK